MKIYINRRPVDGAWGGGNRYLKALVYKLADRGHSIAYDLYDRNIEKYICFDPRPNDKGVAYHDIYKASRETGAKLIQRVGDIGSHGKPALRKMVELSIESSDEVIFVSDWTRKSIGYNGKCHIVYNHPAPEFMKARRKPTEISKKIKIVTHHWSDNLMKGFELYRALDKYIGENGKIEFTYCGRWPSEITSLENSSHVNPLDDPSEIADLISQSDLYVSASIAEPSGNHAIEAKFVGLPVLYHSLGGGIAEYCRGFGSSYSNFEGLLKLIKKWEPLEERLKHYELSKMLDKSIDDTVAEYVEIIESC